jgi:transposase
VRAWRGLAPWPTSDSPCATERILEARAGGMSVRKTAAKFGIHPATVQRLAGPFDASANAIA